MTVEQVIKKCSKELKSKKVEPGGKYYYVKKYKDGLSILKHNNKFYACDMFDAFGPFDTTTGALHFLKVIRVGTHINKQCGIPGTRQMILLVLKIH